MKKFLAAALIVLSTSASAGSLLKNHGYDINPVGYADWCFGNGDECSIDVREPRFITMTPKVLRDLRQVNASVNELVEYVTDKESHNVDDVWTYPEVTEAGKLRGDCEDFEILKRRLLVDRGYPMRAMRLAAVVAPNGEMHAVLVVRTTDGDYVLDMFNVNIGPVPVELWNRKRGFKFVRMESQEPNDKQWISLGNVYVR